MAENAETTLDKIVNLAKRRGFVFPGSEIYGGLANSWDYGPLGVELMNNVKRAWWKRFVQQRADMVGLDASILMNLKVWQASGHIEHFTDPLVECKVCHQRFRADDKEIIASHEHKNFTEPRQFNTMFKTFIGAVEEEASTVYLRPETAQGIFVNFNNILDTMRTKVPFGIAQTGKAFRNEITPGNFTFRTLEFEQMEIEYFVKPGDDERIFDEWLEEQMAFFLDLGLKKENLKLHEHSKEELSHYSKRTVDIQYKFPFGWQELCGLANRTYYDLKRHSEASGQDLVYRDPVTNEPYTPYVIEPSFGVNRLVLAILCDAYTEVVGGRSTTTEASKESEIVLKLSHHLASYQVAVLPLSKKEELTNKALEIASQLRANFIVIYDETQSIGRRYRRQDEIGTPYCVTVDFDTLNDNAVTIRDRDTMEQERVQIFELLEVIQKKFEARSAK